MSSELTVTHERPVRRDRRPGPSGVWLRILIGVAAVAVLIGIRVLVQPAWMDWLPTAARDFFTLSVSVLVESLPFVFLGIGISILVQIWLPDRIWQWLPRNPVLRRMVLSVLGVVFPVCECGNVPMARGLMMRGLGVGESLTFLMAAPILNPVTIVTTYQAFGFDDGILAGRVIGAFLIANLVGWMFSRHPDPDRLLTPGFRAACETDHSESQGRWRRSADAFATETAAMIPALVAGSFIAGAIQVGVPRDWLITIGGNPVVSVGVLMVLAFVVSVCSNVDAFFILSLSAAFAPGAVVAFLVFGAMIDIKMLALLRTTFTTRALALLTGLVGLTTLVIGLGLNLVA
ncbi:MAG: permease [Micropruina sp.]|uniref:permease n=1 Tax=Micropruina sp. TaxID=2737536 RepID=UPI0039E21B43